MFLCSKCRERLSIIESSPPEGEGACEICSNLLEHTEDYFEMFREETKLYEFSTFLIGLRASKPNLQTERELMEKNGVSARDYRKQFELSLGSKIESELNYTADFSRPEVTFVVNQENMDFSLWVKPVYLKGRYLKKRRGIPQSPWITPGKGKESEKSVSEYIGLPVSVAFMGKNYNFFASGREDVDALMLGNGRPFYVEVERPKKRSVELPSLANKVKGDSRGGVEIIDLSVASSEEIEELKHLKSDKKYEVGITMEGADEIDLENELKKYSHYKINQRTPNRVLGIRKDRIREREIRSIEVKERIGKTAVLLITAEAGTYIKEFITGDEGRTIPNLKDGLDINVKIDYLNVLEVK